VRYIGGMIGYSSVLSVFNSSVEVNITMKVNSNGATIGQALGGVVGQAENMTVSTVFVQASVTSDVTSMTALIGGIVGRSTIFASVSTC